MKVLIGSDIYQQEARLYINYETMESGSEMTYVYIHTFYALQKFRNFRKFLRHMYTFYVIHKIPQTPQTPQYYF